MRAPLIISSPYLASISAMEVRWTADAGTLRGMEKMIRPGRQRRVSARLILALLFATAVSGAETYPDGAKDISPLLDLYATHSALQIPALANDDIASLRAGEPVVFVSGQASDDDQKDVVGMGVYGLQIVEAPRLLLWLAVMGGNDERDYRLTTAILERGDAGSYTRYQHIKLPWPVRDRHWVIKCEKTPAMAVVSNGQIWEHRWHLAEDGYDQLDSALQAGLISGMTIDESSKAIYLPENRGAWAMMDLGAQRTLVIAYLNADLGGRFPGPVVRRFTISKLKAGLSSLREFSQRVHLNYDEERPIHDGYGRLVRRQQALQTAAVWPGAHRVTSAD